MKHKSSKPQTLKPFLLIVLLLTSLTSLYPRIFEVRPDGNGHYFPSISAGINAVSNGDTLLVYPGRYYENIDYAGKNITITSLYGVYSEDRSIIRQTIIDGNQRGTVVLFNGRETRQAVLNGFTITNGDGLGLNNNIFNAGGITIQGSSPVISNCIVEYNSAHSGGGIVHRRGMVPSNAFFAGNVVRYNYSTFSIGGLMSHDFPEFCNNNPNSFYYNYGANLNDFGFSSNQQTVVIDTLTVAADIDNHFYRVWTDVEDFELIILNSKIEPVATDLYVSSTGCNDNSGLSAEEPLKSIALAMSKIRPDSLERRNIFVDEGVYTFSIQDQQQFPIKIRSNINIIGADKKSTILDMENRYFGFHSFYFNNTTTDHDNEYVSDFSIKNFTITNGGNAYHNRRISPGIYLYYASNFELEDIEIVQGISANFSALHMNYVFDFSLNNITLEDLHGGRSPLRIGNADGPSTVNIQNVKIHKIRPLYDQDGAIGGGIFIWTGDRATNFPFSMTISNLEVTDCHLGRSSFPGHKKGIILYKNDVRILCDSPRILRIINATIGDNFLGDNNVPYRHAGAIAFEGKVEAEIINSILWNNRPDEIIFSNPRLHPMELTVRNSLIRGGRDDIKIYSPDGPPTINWENNNLDTDPLWMSENELGYYHYMLHEDSPARGAGTLDIPDFEFPEYDLAGNPRIVDGQIDMGAYQWRRLRVRRGDPSRERQAADDFRLRNFPNPVTNLHSERQAGQTRSSTGTNINFTLPDNGKVMIEIYNLKGQFVKRVFDAYIPEGEHNIFWDGRDERGRYVATGFYMYNLYFNEQLVATGRATFIK